MQHPTENLSARVVGLLGKFGDKRLAEAVLAKLSKQTRVNSIVVQYVGTLSEKAQKQLESRLMSKFVEASGVVFVPQDDLIGGLRIKYKDFVYDDSVLSRLRNNRVS